MYMSKGLGPTVVVNEFWALGTSLWGLPGFAPPSRMGIRATWCQRVKRASKMTPFLGHHPPSLAQARQPKVSLSS